MKKFTFWNKLNLGFFCTYTSNPLFNYYLLILENTYIAFFMVSKT